MNYLKAGKISIASLLIFIFLLGVWFFSGQHLIWKKISVLPKIEIVRAETVNILPNSKHANDNSPSALSEITADDATCDPDTKSADTAGDGCYFVDKNDVMQIDTFDVSSIPDSANITGVVLHLEYGAENGYNGTNYVRYDNGSGLTNTTIQPTDITGWSGDLTYDLYAQGVDTKAELQNVDIEFTNNDGAAPDAIHFDYVWIEVTYTVPANQPPTISNVSLNGGNNINLTENTTTLVTATGTISDPDGYSDITQVIGRIFRSGVGENCTLNDNNCYEVSCSTSSCFGTDCQATCNFNVWFHADPTDIGSPWETEYWVAWIKAVDSQNASSSATNITQTVDLNSLEALEVTSEINYGTMYPGEVIDPLNIVSTVTTTGNVAIDVEISGTDMSSDGNTISVSQQHYATSSVAFSSGYALSSTPTALELSTGKPTSHPSDQFQNIYWGIQIPSGTSMGSYLGQITFTAISD